MSDDIQKADLQALKQIIYVVVAALTIVFITGIVARCTREVFTDKVKGAAAVEIAETVTKK